LSHLAFAQVAPAKPSGVDMTQTMQLVNGKGTMKDPTDNTATIPGPDGRPVPADPNCEKCPDDHLGRVCFVALLTWSNDPSNFADVKDQLQRAQQIYAVQDLAKQLLAASRVAVGSPDAVVELSTKQQQLIAGAISKYMPNAVYPAMGLIDPSDFSKPVEIK